MLAWFYLSLLWLFWLLFCGAVTYLILRYVLRGPSLADYDNPPISRIDNWSGTSDGHRQAVALVEQSGQEIRSAPRSQRLKVIREVMARGFCEPTLLQSGNHYRVIPVDNGDIRGEWVLAPDYNPERRILYLHGGSFMAGCPAGHRVITSHIARISGAAVLALDYRLMPEHSRKELIADCQHGYRWLLDNGPDGPTPLESLYVAGDSAGGNLVLMVIAWARDQGLRPANGAIALSPNADMTLSSPTYRSNRQSDVMLGPGFAPYFKVPRTALLIMVWMMTRINPRNPLLSPVFGDLAGLPPVLIQVSEAEMMLGDARRYVNKTRAAGGEAELQTWPDMLHVWHLFEPILPEAREAFERIGQFIDRCETNIQSNNSVATTL